MSNTWEERFKKEFGAGFYEDAVGKNNWLKIKTFIKNELEAKEQEVVKEIKDGLAIVMSEHPELATQIKSILYDHK